jgi:5-formyltetrahydrofolate cyclo-ligase
MRRFAQAGARLALPVTPAKDSTGPLRFHLWRADAALHLSPFGVYEPDPGSESLDPDVLLTPLLAFDRSGGRLGYGAGHYDRTLARLRATKPVVAIGLAFAAQEIDQVPMDAHDQRLDAILTERAFIKVC